MRRRDVLRAAATAAGASSRGRAATAGENTAAGSVYARLGVKPVINAMGTVTILGGSLMPPEVVRALEEASRHFVHLPDLQKRAGERIAQLPDPTGMPFEVIQQKSHRSGYEPQIRVAGAKVDEMKQALGALTGLTLETFVPGIANHVPHLRLAWDEAARGLTAKQVHAQLQAGDPPIHVLLGGPGTLTVSVWMMQGDEHRLVAHRLRGLLEKA
jgi:hypothetical protein